MNKPVNELFTDSVVRVDDVILPAGFAPVIRFFEDCHCGLVIDNPPPGTLPGSMMPDHIALAYVVFEYLNDAECREAIVSWFEKKFPQRVKPRGPTQ